MSNKWLFSIGFVCLLVVCSVNAQLPSGAIVGTLTDSTGAVVPDVEAIAVNVQTGESRSAISNGQGRFVITNLRSGEYDLTAALEGFQTTIRRGVRVEIGGEARVDFEMQVGELRQLVEVTGELPLVNTSSSEVSGVVESAQVENLPLNGRSFTDLMTLQPGVRYITAGSTGAVSGQGKRISMSGARGQDNTFLLDGSDITDKNSVVPGSVAGVLLGVETVAEFKVLTSAYGAEYGTRAGGTMSAVTRSGTNEFHGTVFEYFRNSALDARNFFDRDLSNPTVRSDPPPFKRNQFGFVGGGPIKQNRTFIFGSYEGLRDRLGASVFGQSPTADGRLGIGVGQNGADVEVDPALAPYLALWPLPNGQDFGNGTGEINVPQSIPTNEDYFLVRLDHQLSDKLSIFGRLVSDDSEKLQSSATGLWRQQLKGRNWFTTIQGSMIFSPQLINNLQFAFNRSVEDVSNPAPEGVDALGLSFIPGRGMGALNVGQLSNLGPGSLNPQLYTTNKFQIIDNAVYVRGNHNLKFGMLADRLQFNSFFGVRYLGAFTFPNFETFIRNQPSQFFGTIESDPVRGVRQRLFAFYVQDDYRVLPNLTLNLGLRYEFITTPTEVNGKVSNLRDVVNDAEFTVGDPYLKNPSLKNFAPRIGVAWDPFSNGKTSVRAGAGIFYDEILPYYYRATFNFVPPFNVTYRLRDAQLPTAWEPGQPLPSASRAILGTLEYDAAQPYAFQYNATIEHEVLPDTSFTIGYRGMRGIKLYGITNVNQKIPSPDPEGTDRKFFPADAPRPNPNFADIYVYPARDSWYNGLDLGLKRRFGDGFQYQFSYSYGKSIDTASGHSGSTNLRSASDAPQDQINPKGSERALSGHDIRNYFTANAVYELPFGRNLTGMAGKFLSGWQTNGLVALSDGSPVTLNLSYNRSRAGNVVYAPRNDRPNLVAGQSNNPVIGDPNRYFDPSAFELQDPGYFGNLAKNTVIAPGRATFDFSLIKNTSLGESKNLEFRAEFFNLFNRANFDLPNRFIFTNTSGNPSPTAGRITGTSTSSRQIQFALKFSF